MHILLTNVHLDCRGEGSSNSNASRDESVETGDESVETGDESIEAGEKTPQSCYNYRSNCYGKQFYTYQAVHSAKFSTFQHTKNTVQRGNSRQNIVQNWISPKNHRNVGVRYR